MIIEAPFKLGQQVRVAQRTPAPGDWRADWYGITLSIVGVSLNRNGEVRYHVSEDWPRNGGFDDVRVEDLEAI